MTNPSFWNQILVWPIVNLLVAFYRVFETLHIPGALGFAIILLTICIRLLLYPLMHAQLKSAQKMARLKPHMDELSKKHKENKDALRQAQLALYKEHNINPAAGCLPLLVQFPVLIALYGVFNQLLANGNTETFLNSVNQVVYVPWLKLTSLSLDFFGINLGIKPSQWQTAGIWLLAIPVITAGLQWYQTKTMMPSPAKPAEDKLKQIQKAKGGKDDKEEKKPEDTAMEMQKQMALITPLMIGYFSLQFPIGLALYWNVFGIFGIIQQKLVQKSS